jgi:ferrous iron transport protein B
VLASSDPAQAHSLVLADSLVGRFGRAVEPVLRPLGFDWRIGSALVGASAAKEVFVAQMGIIFGVGESADSASILRQRLGETYSVATALSMLVYLLVASPCVVTCAITRRETGSWKWAALQWGGLTLLGYVVALITYQSARLAGLGG